MTLTFERASVGPAEWPNRRWSRWITRGGIAWHVQVMGAGPALLLLHGTGASSHSFRDVIPLLAERFTVVAPDLPGHAFSSAPASFEPTLPGTAAAVADLVRALELPPAIVVGHSAGAALAVQLSLDGALEPHLLVGLAAALVPFRGLARAVLPSAARVLARASRLIDLRMGTTERVDRMLRSTGSSLDRDGVELYRRLSARPAHVSAVLAMMACWDLEPLFARLPELAVDLLLVAGDRDRAVPLAQHRLVTERTGRARLVVVRGVGHLLHEEQPLAVARLILAEADRWALARSERASVNRG